MSHDHPHSHDESHDSGPPSEHEVMSRAMQELLEEKNLITAAQVRQKMERFEEELPYRGSKVVARAWTDPAYRKRLVSDAASAVAELGFLSTQGEHMLAVENTGRSRRFCR